MLMKPLAPFKASTANEGQSLSYHEQIKILAESCTNCGLCVKECGFLQSYGTPKVIAEQYNPQNPFYKAMPFECSLCTLCAALCPVDLNPADMFLAMRRQAAAHGLAPFPEHSTLLNYEKRGTSRRYTFYALPSGCDTVFFPGCTLPGTRPHTTFKLYERLREGIPSLGVVLDCCLKPSHDLGRHDHFTAMFEEMRGYLLSSGVRRVLVACPSCYKIFRRYGGDLSVVTVYEALRETPPFPSERLSGEVAVHDPCVLRFNPPVHEAVRDILQGMGLTVEEMRHRGKTTLCCGEGGAVNFVAPELAQTWRSLRKEEAKGRPLITYCAGCANFLDGNPPAGHLLDVFFDPAALSGKAKVAKAPFTYWNRLRLKARFKKSIPAVLTRERTFAAPGQGKERGLALRLLLLLLVLGAVLATRFTGLSRYLEEDTLRQAISGYGALAPIIYMLLYSVAPALFLPGLPITIVGGVLFGPFWGVVYTITGATIGACVAFLISRYLARSWIQRKLAGSRWRKLDQGVERHGWKVVAFTRLIPLFPFNLLNYALGLTRIPFTHYAATTFVCMLPACIAFIVFSSSLLEVVRGKISLEFLVGALLIIIVSAAPFFYQRWKAKRGVKDLL
jgi:uncharacterized membrane protein YdjX (TVP38/TMEM64 family)/Fe-S oxidoreductase